MPDDDSPLLRTLGAILNPPPPQPLQGLAGLLAPAPTVNTGLIGLANALATPQPAPPAVGLLGLASLCAPTSSTPGLGLAGLFGTGSGASQTSLLGEAMVKASEPKRRVFFSFNFQNDINRVNVVRNSWRFRPEDGTQPAEWFDNSIWETAKRTGQSALKKLIHEGMNNSSVTCVLAGAETWSRPWVRYEIAYGLARGNGLFTVHIDGVNCMKNGAGRRGPNPLDYIGLRWDDTIDRAYLWENFNGSWREYALYTDPVTWPKWLPNVTARPHVMPLSRGSMGYDYAKQNGYENLASWARLAADTAGK